MEGFGGLIYTPETAKGEAVAKAESHTPKIDAPDRVKAGEAFTVKISVGPHPNKVEHSIRWVDVYFEEEGRSFNPIHLARLEFTPEYVEPEVEIKVKLSKSGTLYALGYCNLHGVWEARKKIVVE